MKLAIFFEKFNRFADAPAGVQKIREFVLQLALQGKLVEQRQSEGDAAQLLSAVLRERAARSAKLGVPRESAPGNGDEQPFHIPPSWAWSQLGNIALQIQYGYTASAVHGATEIRMLRISDIQYNRVDWQSVPGCHIEKDEVEKYLLSPNDILIARTGGTIGKSFIVPRAPVKAVFASYLIRVTPPKSIEARYLKYFLESPLYWTQLRAMSLGTGQPNVNGQALGRLKIPLPPHGEQKRIVPKVDEFMRICDRLEEQQRDRDTRQVALSRASLARFAKAPTATNLEYLFHPSYSIPPADLRNAIVNLAVQGKLVSHDSNDEPAEELVVRIAQLRRTRKATEFPPVTSDECPFEIPHSWCWVRLGNISLSSDSGWSPQCLTEPRSGSDWGILKVSAVSWGEFRPEENKALPPRTPGRPDCEVKAGDFLLSRANTEELVARSVVIDQTPPRLMMSDKIVRFTFPDEIERSFINLANISDPSRAYYARNASGTSSSMKNVGREAMCNLPIPLPPLAEQRRIVAKVNELTALVDELENQLNASCAAGMHLLESLLAELTGALCDRSGRSSP